MFNALPVNLTRLELSSNNLTYLQAGSLPIQQLRYLRLSYNKIKKIDTDFFKGITSLYVDFAGNECINTAFEARNELELDTMFAVFLKKCYNTGHKIRVSAIFLISSVFLSSVYNFY